MTAERWEFFVSYTQADQAWAEWIAWELEESGHRVLVQAWDFVPGSNWVQGMQDGVVGAERTIAVLSPAYLESVYGAVEWQSAFRDDPDGRHRKLLTVRVADCDRPGILGLVVGEDLFAVPETTARTRLRDMAVRARHGRANPDTPPPFPGGRAITREPRFPEALPRVWNVPARNPHFTGRAADLDEIRSCLSAAGTVTVAAVRGMGGVGKTALGNEYAHLNTARYDAVWWIRAEQPAAIPAQFTALAEHLGLDPDPERLPAQVHRALRDVAGWLLVFDNATTTTDLGPWLPPSLMPPSVPGHVLVTTRRDGFAAIGAIVDIDVVSPDEAITLLRSRAPGLDSEIAAEIATELGRLPLALEQAGAYLAQSGIPAPEYLDLIRTRADALRRTIPDLNTSSRGDSDQPGAAVASVFDLSLDALTEACPSAARLLDICAYLAPEPIPDDLFTTHPDELPEPLAAAVSDPLSFNDTLAAIVGYSLAKRTPTGLHLHRLVQAALRTRHTTSATP